MMYFAESGCPLPLYPLPPLSPRPKLFALKRDAKLLPGPKSSLPEGSSGDDGPEESEEIRKIKKVQSFFRGWLCRRRWKQIVEEYIHSPHAESMRKRNR